MIGSKSLIFFFGIGSIIILDYSLKQTSLLILYFNISLLLFYSLFLLYFEK